MNGTYNVLEAARSHKLVRVYIPSSIAAFGPETPRENTPQETVLRPKTMYGVTKVAGELLADYYVRRFSVDVRGSRFPGIISHATNIVEHPELVAQRLVRPLRRRAWMTWSRW